MSNTVISSLEEVTTEWLTAILIRSRALNSGAVQGFTVDTGQGNWTVCRHR